MKRFIFLVVFISFSHLSIAQSKSNLNSDVFGQSFIPDYNFHGSNLTGWHINGKANWQAENGLIIANPSSSNEGSLLLDSSYQDVGFHCYFKLSPGTEAAVIMRITKAGNGMKGVMLSLKPGDVLPYAVTFDAEGKITSREKLRHGGGIDYRIAPTPDTAKRRTFHFPTPPPPSADIPVKQPNTSLRPDGWNQIEIFLDENVIRARLNDGDEIGGVIDDQDIGIDGYGPFGLYVSGTGKVQFKNVMYKDIALKVTPKEQTSPRFTAQRISDMYYSWGVTTADFNKDGILDIVAGPYIYYGPDYTRHREIYPASAASPSREFSNMHVEFAYDFNHDGWPDLLYTAFSTTLYMNPHGEHRRWKSYNILPGAHQGEITEFRDIDGDGIPELIYEANGSMWYAKPHPSDPTKPWIQYRVSEEGYGIPHGIGIGDINGDGRLDIVGGFGWWEQPAALDSNKTWKYHPAILSRYGRYTNLVGGSIMGVYDVNGDGLNDVVTSLNAHGFGLAWFEQHRDASGKITFIEHMISDDYSYKHNAGGVTFSEAHGSTFADVDGDGIPDFIVGKRYWSHLDDYFDPDPYGPPVIYWYRTVRDKNAPGGARFVPELINNRSGVGSQVEAVDLNNDGAVDIITPTDRGIFIFWNKIKQVKKK